MFLAIGVVDFQKLRFRHPFVPRLLPTVVMNKIPNLISRENDNVDFVDNALG